MLDLRVLAMRATMPSAPMFGPEQVIDVDIGEPGHRSTCAASSRTTEICALVADPGQRRPLRWAMTMCLLDEDGRCDRGRPHAELGSGVIDDPDEAPTAQQPCATIALADTFIANNLTAILRDAIAANPVQALGGVEYAVALTIGGVDAEPADDVYATKQLRIAPRIPVTRRPNRNPTIDILDGAEIGGRDHDPVHPVRGGASVRRRSRSSTPAR